MRVYGLTEVGDLLKTVSKNTEDIMLEQLEDMLKRGVLVVEKSEPVLIQDAQTQKVTVQQKIKLTLKDKEYIERLEGEVRTLTYRLDCIKSAFYGNEDSE